MCEEIQLTNCPFDQQEFSMHETLNYQNICYILFDTHLIFGRLKTARNKLVTKQENICLRMSHSLTTQFKGNSIFKTSKGYKWKRQKSKQYYNYTQRLQ